MLRARADVLPLRQLLHPLPEVGNGFLLACGVGTLAVLDAALPELDGPPRASAVDAPDTRDVNALGPDRRQGGGLICVATVRVHSPRFSHVGAAWPQKKVQCVSGTRSNTDRCIRRIENYQREITAAMCVMAGCELVDQTYGASTVPHTT